MEDPISRFFCPAPGNHKLELLSTSYSLSIDSRKSTHAGVTRDGEDGKTGRETEAQGAAAGFVRARKNNNNDNDNNKTTGPMMFFVHGGCASAEVWREYLGFFGIEHGIPCYAVNLRGHGRSWTPQYLRILLTDKRALARDLRAGLTTAVGLEKAQGQSGEVVLIAHSAGGGLAQYALSEGLLEEKNVTVRGLVLVGSVPCFGMFDVFLNWLRLDAWMRPRMLLHGFHPLSPLSTPRLIKRAFFCDDYPVSRVDEFQRDRMARYESLAWPLGLMWPFVNVQRVVRSVWHDYASDGDRDRIMMVVGEKDRLVTVELVEKMVDLYRNCRRSETKQGEGSQSERHPNLEDEKTGSEHGVRFYVVPGAGHHTQNDLQWRNGADEILRFYEHLCN